MTFIYVVGIILLIQLCNLQIIHGEEYREESNTRLTRESTLEAARGNILDRTGNTIAGNSMGFALELYKSKISNQDLNTTILNMINVLEKNGDSYVNSFPISINPYEYQFSSEEKLAAFKKEYKIPENARAEEAFQILKEKYEIQYEDPQEARKIMAVRYEISQKGYSSTKAMKISDNIARESAIEFNERSNEFPGLNVIVEPIRSYPKGNLASHIVGYIGKISEDEYSRKKDQGYENNDSVGKGGIEYVLEEYLKGTKGVKQIDMAVDGTTTGEYIAKEATAGANVVLTIDANLQAVTEQSLKNNIEKIRNGGFGQKYDAKAGAAVAMNVRTGEILALASYPDFEPQVFVGGISSDKWSQYAESRALYNRAVQGSYAPGSIFKMVTAVAGLETGSITTTEKINDTGVYYLGKQAWKCWYWTDYHRGHGWLNVSGAIQHSCNYFFYETGKRMGIDNLEKYARYFGFGEKTGVELPDETAGSIAARKEGENWYQGNTLNAAIGQGANDVSPIQVAKYLSILTNGGKQIEPTVIKSVINADGSEVSRGDINKLVDDKLGLSGEKKEDLQMNQNNINAVLEGMRSVTSETGGTAYARFKDFNIEVGGKTGSAEAGTYVNAWFAGFAPFDNPEIAVVVLVENGKHGNYTAEVARDIIAQYFGMDQTEVSEDVTAIPYTESVR